MFWLMVRAACALNTPKAMVIIRNTMINPWLERVRNTRRKEAYNAGLQRRLNSEKISHTTSGSTRTIKRPAPIINRLLDKNRSGSSEAPSNTRCARMSFWLLNVYRPYSETANKRISSPNFCHTGVSERRFLRCL